MNCEVCLKANPVARCTDQLTIGSVDPAISTVDVTIQNQATGKNYHFNDIDVDLYGDNVVIDTSGIEFMRHWHKIEVFESGAPRTPLIVTIDGQEGCCVEFLFDDREETEETLTVEKCETV